MARFLVAANLAIPLAVLLFAAGFFPYKPFMPGLASHADYARHGDAPAAQFDRLIFMVVDALRSDFVFSGGSGFTFTQKLIRGGEAVPFTAHASPPTVTMPRVKAMTSGSVPSFVDAILNFAEGDESSSMAGQDTWLAQVRAGRDGAGGGRLVMFGDDTWLKLFPGMFVRADGTSSFFVSDFTEVDRNVTRNIPRELRGGDWDAMILHYLGLDHIGHKAGPNSPNMIPKHMEMDGIVKQIYDAMTRTSYLKNTLLVLCGDHGMNEAGNHGGSGFGETSTALVFISPKLKPLHPGRTSPVAPHTPYGFDFYKGIDQSDLAATISSLLGLPVPRNNLGVVIPDFLRLWKDPKDQMQLLLRNALQIKSLVKATFPDFDNSRTSQGCGALTADTDILSCKWNSAMREVEEYRQSGTDVEPSLLALAEFCQRAQRMMSGAASNYDIPRMATGVSLAAIAFMSSVAEVLRRFSPRNVDVLVLLALNVAYGVMMFASSYVEEEQHFWYWTAAGWLAYLRARCIQRDLKRGVASASAASAAPLAALLAHRLLQRWNQTGQKHAGAPDIATSYLLHHPAALWALVALAYAAAAARLARALTAHLRVGAAAGAAGALLAVAPAALFKVAFTAADSPELFFWLQGETLEALERLPLVAVARGVFATLGVLAALLVAKERRGRSGAPGAGFLRALHALLTVLLMTQTRAHNVPLFLVFAVQHAALASMRLAPVQVGVAAVVLGHAAFFGMGGSNAMSSVDLSSAYNGVSGYNVGVVGLLVFVGNWAGPIWWAVAAAVLLAEERGRSARPAEKPRGDWVAEEHKHLAAASSVDAAPRGASGPETSPWVDCFAVSTLYVSGSLLAVMAACLVLRTHLFIWTVFSPKYLYSMAWSLGHHYLVSLGLCGGLWSLQRA